MYLQSGNLVRLGAGSIRDTASLLSSEESVTQSRHLPTIVEDSRDTYSESGSSMASEGTILAASILKYNMTIEYYADSDFGAKIYVNPI